MAEIATSGFSVPDIMDLSKSRLKTTILTQAQFDGKFMSMGDLVRAIFCRAT